MHQTTTRAADEYVGTSEAARHIGVSTRTIQRMEARGQLHPKKLPSGHRRYSLRELDAITDGTEGRSAS